MSKASAGQDSFLIRIFNQQNATWQGTVTWTESNRTESFRSALELIKLIDSAIEETVSKEEQ